MSYFLPDKADFPDESPWNPQPVRPAVAAAPDTAASYPAPADWSPGIGPLPDDTAADRRCAESRPTPFVSLPRGYQNPVTFCALAPIHQLAAYGHDVRRMAAYREATRRGLYNEGL